jgi:hypothetical protein
MMYSTTVQKINTKDLVFWVVQNSQNCGSKIVNSTDFETSNILSEFVIFVYPRIHHHPEILHSGRVHHWLHLDVFFRIF